MTKRSAWLLAWALTGVLSMVAAPSALAQAVPAPVTFAPATETAIPAVRARSDCMAAELRAALGVGPRFGIVILRLNGDPLVWIDGHGRYVPASNTKLVTTLGAFALLGDTIRQPDTSGGMEVALADSPHMKKYGPIVVLRARGDARMSSADGCFDGNCLSTLADAVAAKTRKVGGIAVSVPGAEYPFSPGMSWNNIGAWHGTASGSVVVDDNEVQSVVAAVNNALVRHEPGGRSSIDMQWNGRFDAPLLVASGVIGGSVATTSVRTGVIDAEAHLLRRFKSLLEARGVRVSETPDIGSALKSAPPARALARLTPPPLIDDLRIINKDSQNLHADMLLLRIGQKATGVWSRVDGVAALHGMLDGIGIDRRGIELSDGSGMSNYNRMSPDATARMLLWAHRQPWGADYRATLPIAGVDGTLKRRFVGTPLAGKLWAKTGTINAASSLSGWMTTARGETVLFAAFVNDIPGDASVTQHVDAALVRWAAQW